MTANHYFGVAFEPYVGPWVGTQPVLYDAYSLAQVTVLLAPVAGFFDRIATYSQGTFVWQGTPLIQDSNRWNIQAAKANGLQVTAGCYQQGANPGADSINVAWTKTEIDYALSQAALYGNVDELVIGSECIWGPNSAGAITDLIAYARAQIQSLGLTIAVSTRQRWDVLAGVGNTTPAYATTRAAILALLAACDFVYADVYAYFDPGIAAAIGTNPTKEVFQAAVTASVSGSLSALQAAFTANGVATTIRVGEVGWPTSGSQPAQPDAALANALYARWNFESMGSLLLAQGLQGFAFEAYDEPWKGPADGSSSESSFGIWTAQGSASSVSAYTLTGETEKYRPGPKPPGCMGWLLGGGL